MALGLMFVSLVLLEMHQGLQEQPERVQHHYIASLRMRHGRNIYGPMGIYPYVYPPSMRLSASH